jgi:hypothetical protein
VLSAYLWNMGDAANHVTVVVDFNDAPQEPQLTLYRSDPNADQGYFVYRGFNTANTGVSLLLRVFYDGFAGTGTAAAYYPLAAQWDNIAITKAADFASPAANGSGETSARSSVLPIPQTARTYRLRRLPPCFPSPPPPRTSMAPLPKWSFMPAQRS